MIYIGKMRGYEVDLEECEPAESIYKTWSNKEKHKLSMRMEAFRKRKHEEEEEWSN